MTDIAPQYRNDATLQFSETAIWNKHKHNVRFGADYRRLWTTLRSNADPRGTFTFTGFDTGNALADFLAGTPQSTALQYSATPYFFSTNSYDFFVQDDWRLRSNFTFQAGLRYEYIAPYTEANNRLANLDLGLTPGLTSVALRDAGRSCTVQRRQLQQPDKARPEQFCAARRLRLEGGEKHGGAGRIRHQLQPVAVRHDHYPVGLSAAVRRGVDADCDDARAAHLCQRVPGRFGGSPTITASIRITGWLTFSFGI